MQLFSFSTRVAAACSVCIFIYWLELADINNLEKATEKKQRTVSSGSFLFTIKINDFHAIHHMQIELMAQNFSYRLQGLKCRSDFLFFLNRDYIKHFGAILMEFY